MVGAFQLIQPMSHQPPLDQWIVDEFFQLISNNKTKDVGWLYAMVATYGLKPDELSGFTWGPEATLIIKNKKRPVRPLHPQWVLLFNLKEKQPRLMRSCWDKLNLTFCQAIATQLISLNVTDLLLAHRLRKSHYQSFKSKKTKSLAFAGVS